MGTVAHDYVVDQTVRNPRRPAVPADAWQLALRVATTDPESVEQRTWEVGVAAHGEHAFAHALTAMRTLAEAGDASALFNAGVLLGQLDRSEEAVAVYDEVVTRFGDAPELALREWVAKALVNKGVRLGQLDRSEEAVAVYDEVVTRFGEPDPGVN